MAKNTPITLRAREILFGQVLQLVLESADARATLDFSVVDDKTVAIGPDAGPV